MDSDSFVVGDSRSANSLAWVDTENFFNSSRLSVVRSLMCLQYQDEKRKKGKTQSCPFFEDENSTSFLMLI